MRKRSFALVVTLLLAVLLSVTGCSDAESKTDQTVASVQQSTGTYAQQITVDDASFTDEEIAYAEENLGYERYSDLDALGRCGEAMACLGPETLPARGEERESISEVHPTGWHSIRYDFMDGGSLYNRSHLIGWALSAENANERNLVTGTRWMNADVMRPFEEDVADYIYTTDNHVLYRSTPVFEGDELVCRGIRVEALSLEDGGSEINFDVWCPNLQPGVTIDYATGDAWIDEETIDDVVEGASSQGDDAIDRDAEGTFILNTSSKKIHKPDCEGVQDMSPRNREEFTGSIAEAERLGYNLCPQCLG